MGFLSCYELPQHLVLNVEGIERAAQTVVRLASTGRHTLDPRATDDDLLPSIICIVVQILYIIDQTNQMAVFRFGCGRPGNMWRQTDSGIPREGRGRPHIRHR